jgi:hypothetical protein
MAEGDQLVLDILKHFLQSPEAEDSLEGISSWKQADPVTARAALNDVVNRQLLTVRRSSDGRTLFRLNPEKSEEVRHMAAPPPAYGPRRDH